MTIKLKILPFNAKFGLVKKLLKASGGSEKIRCGQESIKPRELPGYCLCSADQLDYTETRIIKKSGQKVFYQKCSRAGESNRK